MKIKHFFIIIPLLLVVAITSLLAFKKYNSYYHKDHNSNKSSYINAIISQDNFVSEKMLEMSGNQDINWLHTHGNYTQNRFYPSSQINIDNVNNLNVFLKLSTDVIAPIESAPLIVNGIIYISTAFNNVYAFDAFSGKVLWHFKYLNKQGDQYPYNCCGPNNRGLAIYKHQLFMATLDAHIISLDSRTGRLLWEKPLILPFKRGYSATASPVVIDNKVVIGVGDGEYAIRGFLKAFDVNSGKLLWTFYTIPDQGQEGVFAKKDATGHDLKRDIANEQKLINAGIYKSNLDLGGGIWGSPAIDLKTRTIYLVVGNPYPDYEGETRPGDNLFTDSMVAIDLDTGKYKWHFQYIPHDLWDLDSASPPILANIPNDKGEIISVVMHANKMGNIFIHSAKDGHLIRFSDPMIPQDLWSKKSIGTYIKGSPIPDMESGVNWNPMAFNPHENLIYAMNRVKEPYLFDKKGFHKYTGKLVAINVMTGRVVWSVKNSLPLQGGILSTSGGLVFFGDGDGLIHALNGLDGKELWKFQCDAGANGVPSSYKLDSKQYLIIGCGGNRLWNFKRGNKFYIFSLPS